MHCNFVYVYVYEAIVGSEKKLIKIFEDAAGNHKFDREMSRQTSDYRSTVLLDMALKAKDTLGADTIVFVAEKTITTPTKDIISK